ncbi:MAG TPA: sodium:proton antiporter [Methylomirabilota bacterium]|nr:sodium:proton antiporter [Methylomirabilota bacterium]
MASIIEQVEIVLLVAALVGMLARRLRVPTTVGLVLAGIGFALLPGTISITLTKDLIFDAFLPPLIFEASLYIDWRELRKDLAVILTLATLGVLLTAGVITLGMHYFAHWSWEGAALFGILMSATDPVSVIATLKEVGMQGRLRLLIEAESLFNDGTAAVAFSTMLVFLTGQKLTAGGIGWTLILSIAGGILCGAIITWGILFLSGRTTDHLTEITLTTVAAYGSFLLADRLHVSGVFASLTAGLIVGNAGFLWSIYSREAVESFWEYAAFVANAFIFVLIGIRTGEQHFASIAALIPVAVTITLLARVAAIYPCCALFTRSTLRVTSRHQHILFWGGLRGALALALALGLPPELPYREEIITTAFVIVAFSIFAQGLTMPRLLRRLGEAPYFRDLFAR